MLPAAPALRALELRLSASNRGKGDRGDRGERGEMALSHRYIDAVCEVVALTTRYC